MNPRRSASSLPKPGRSAYGPASAVVLLLIPVVVLAGGNSVREFLNFGAGVLSLVALSCSVIWGLVATDRIFLNTRQRLVAQAVHRTTAISSVAFLLLHVTVKLALDHTQFIAAVIPFSLGFTGLAGLIGLGSVAGLLMIFTAITGALRSAFASPAPVAARWRAMHMLAYPAWCCALVHGLYAGRAVKSPLFTVLYELCLVGVMAALALRSAPRPFKRKVADRIVAFIGTDNRIGREDLEASRARNAETAAMAGLGARSGDSGRRSPGVPTAGAAGSAPLYDTSGTRTMSPEPGNGFAAAYRTVSNTPRGQGGQGSFAEGTGRMDLPDMQGTGPLPRMDGGAPAGPRWPAPSPPPVGEAPPSAYDPMTDTFAGGMTYQAGYGGYDNSSGTFSAAGESNAPFGTYNPNDTYNSGPASDTPPGAFDAPGSGESWNAPSGGYK
ncbi:ferric reductase-like transmembrane domain-containing protein [Streptomyces sp. B3I8]|uniref:ferric reductase-like transmembrane domain-containing protein n=1 Tax=Streptomyces sp. B3I8 TaxID=3042303 RepID=UPI002789CF69|nr:ferric reductase-like transmembrane domain-containing protein [Streptomyces sp. B3I8]MDQ0786940.1 DMSO/TMAO reductase YedYZ heme-binding membrane subunit [Streptomyces sp. B3I8]